MSKIAPCKQVVLIVLDGWGYREEKKHNPIAMADKPVFDLLWNAYPHTLLQASGQYVGLPKGEMGNSEVGHNVIGAGRVVKSDIVRINASIDDGSFARNPAFERLFDHVLKHKSTLHINGLLSSGGVHSHEDHLYAFLNAAKARGVKDIAIHAFTDGMDTLPQEAVNHVRKLEQFLKALGIGRIASVSGRFYAMDRDNNWDRIKRVEDALFECKGNVCHIAEPSKLLTSLYEEKVDDMHIGPIVCLDSEGNGCAIKDNDGLFFFNFRPDRARMLSQKVAERAIKSNIYFVTMTRYDDVLKSDVAFPPVAIEHCLGEIVSQHGLTQARIAESEKYAHATYFLNTGHEKPYARQENILIPSIKSNASYDEMPEMQADKVADAAVEHISKGTNFVFVNFANPDVVGHTGNEQATIKAVEATDRALGKVILAVVKNGGVAIVTADHGNAEVKFDEVAKAASVTHTTNPVPMIITRKGVHLAGGGLADVAPTILCLFGITPPSEMTGTCLME